MPPSTRTAAKDEKDEKGQKAETVQCMSCASTLQPDHTGIICGNNHHICNSVNEDGTPSCALNFVNHVLAEGPTAIPVKCMDCHVDVIPNTFERNVPVEALTAYTDTCVLVGGAPAPGEKWHRCPLCPLMIILIDSDGEMIYRCGNCDESSCMICSAKVSTEREMERHLTTCGLHGALKNEFVDLINQAVQNACPRCEHKGQKDDNCTHMRCPQCLCRWCYMCGQPRDEVDGGEYEHNSNWENNPRRCPMYMNYIHRVSDDWPTDDQTPGTCVNYYHKRKILYVLKQKVEEVRCFGLHPLSSTSRFPRLPCVPCVPLPFQVGRDRVEEMLKLFPATFNHAEGAWTVEEILDATPWRNF